MSDPVLHVPFPLFELVLPVKTTSMELTECPVCGRNVPNLVSHAEFMVATRASDPLVREHAALIIMES